MQYRFLSSSNVKLEDASFYNKISNLFKNPADAVNIGFIDVKQTNNINTDLQNIIIPAINEYAVSQHACYPLVVRYVLAENKNMDDATLEVLEILGAYEFRLIDVSRYISNKLNEVILIHPANKNQLLYPIMNVEESNFLYTVENLLGKPYASLPRMVYTIVARDCDSILYTLTCGRRLTQEQMSTLSAIVEDVLKMEAHSKGSPTSFFV